MSEEKCFGVDVRDVYVIIMVTFCIVFVASVLGFVPSDFVVFLVFASVTLSYVAVKKVLINKFVGWAVVKNELSEV